MELDKLSAIATEVLADPQAKTTLQGWIKTSLMLIGRWKARSEPIDLDSLTETAGLLAEGLDVAGLIVQQLAADCPEWHDPAAPTAS